MNTRKSHRKSNVELGKQFYITNQEHDLGLLVCNSYRDMIDDDEFIAINRLCMAYGNDERLDADFYHKAMSAIRKVRESAAFA